MRSTPITTKALTFLVSAYDRFLEAQQMRISSSFEGLSLLALLGLVCGLVAGGVIILFRLLIDATAEQFLAGNSEGFEQLSGITRFCLCVGGALLVGIILHKLKPSARNLGVVHVIERLEYHQGHLPFRNAITQFVLAGISLLSGQSVGREGPSIHLGASAGSVLARALRVPNNGVRVLVGCGVAAAIAAAFNTPLAGVIFAMEVVIMEYSVTGFTPVIIAAISATTLSRIIFGDDTAFTVPPFSINAVDEIPIVVLMGAIIGCIAAVFIRITLFTSGLLINRAIWIRTLLAGVITGCLALVLPQIMGTGYDTVNHVLLAQIGLAGVILLTIAKTITTATAIGLGIPAGLIGPVLFIGAAAGSAIGLVTQLLFPAAAGSGFYAMLGMAAMMAATLQAPLAALIYLLEMTANHAILLPGMAAVITASLVTRVVFRQESIYRHLLLSRGLDYRNSPMSQALRRVGVASVMERNIEQHAGTISPHEANQLLAGDPRWILLKDKQDKNLNSLLPATDLARFLTELESNKSDAKTEYQEDSKPGNESVLDSPALDSPRLDLFRIPAKRIATDSIKIVATLQEAHEKMKSSACDILFVTGAHGATKDRIYGVITREHIERSYRV